MTDQFEGRVCVLARLQAPHLYEPYENPRYPGNPKFSAILRIYEPKYWDMIENAKVAAAKKKWPADWQKKLSRINGNENNKLLRMPEDTDEYKFLKATASPNYPPRLLHITGKGANRVSRPVEQSEMKFVSGAYVQAVLDLWAYDNMSIGIGATLVALNWRHAGEPFGGPVVTENDFEDLGDDPEAAESEEDPWL